MKITPITPIEVSSNIEKSFPEFVIEAVNNCIQKNSFGKKSFSIKRGVIIDEILKCAPPETTVDMIFDNHWLDFEKLYAKYGWEVKYCSPGWDETYEEYFSFNVK
jgi:hypothetical protein